MDLSHETLAECVTALRQGFIDRLGSERRILPRFRVWAPLQIAPTSGDEPPISVWVRDLSRGGIGVMYTRALPMGWEFTTLLPRLASRPIRVRCAVVYCAVGAPDMFSIGARFVEQLPDSDE